MKSSKIPFQDILLGKVYEIKVTVTQDLIQSFAKVSGDFNPLHVNKTFAGNTPFKKNVAHGMLLGSFFSQIIGMLCPGENSLYLSQSLQFKNPVLEGDTVVVRGTVLDKNESVQVVTFKTEILNQNKVAVTGEAKVKVMDYGS